MYIYICFYGSSSAVVGNEVFMKSMLKRIYLKSFDIK